jgi:hypothetical protein
VPGGITSIMPSIPADLLSYINCIENLPVYKGESTLPKRDVNLLSLYADNNINHMPTNLMVCSGYLVYIKLLLIVIF